MVSEEDHASLLALGQDFDRVWHSPRCPPELKKKIIRSIVEEVIVDEPQPRVLSFIVHWKGGAHTRFESKKPWSRSCARSPRSFQSFGRQRSRS